MQGHSTVLRASSSIPCFSPIVTYKGKAYLDGGTSDPIPIRRALADGCDRVVVVLTRERGFIKAGAGARPCIIGVFRKQPGMIRALDQRHEVYNETLAFLREKEADGTAPSHCPRQPLGVGRFEKDRASWNRRTKPVMTMPRISRKPLPPFFDRTH